ncbi:DUF2971 domain-containing protein [Deefgea piscis]|uniref:DUF2971 domain-containing protein n=1 Tax=Deefgea piscis TaxID=2739061 RepID=A0A6M8SL32_9NEIS|nr:DUF2971 domain-containing protein [Deefgea piscis]QKJ65882.1 DUF2971 domain-containing protein [Deefgea piscis]
MTILYRYFPLDQNSDEHFDRLISVLDGRIFFSSPHFFNDPFEMTPIFRIPSDAEYEKIFSKNIDLTERLSKSQRNKIAGSINLKLMSSKNRTVDEDWVKELGVLCLSEDHKNILMWSHYGKNHTGICLGFDSEYPPFSKSQLIIYNEARPQVPVMPSEFDDEELIKATLLTKSPHWAYEKEWRCIKRPIRESEKNFYKAEIKSNPNKINEIAELLVSEGGSGMYEFNANAIRRVVFGVRTNEHIKQRVIAEIAKRNLSPKLSSLIIDNRRFTLNEVRIKDKALIKLACKVVSE